MNAVEGCAKKESLSVAVRNPHQQVSRKDDLDLAKAGGWRLTDETQQPLPNLLGVIKATRRAVQLSPPPVLLLQTRRPIGHPDATIAMPSMWTPNPKASC